MLNETNEVVEIEINSRRNRGLYFAPLSRRLRGRLEFARDSEPEAARRARDWEYGVPGEIVGLDVNSGQAYVRDPLQESRFRRLRERLERRGFQLRGDREDYTAVDKATWAYWMRRALAGGHATISCGESKNLAEIEGDPQTDFQPRPKSAADARLDRLIDALAGLLQARAKPASVAERRPEPRPQSGHDRRSKAGR